MDVESRSGGLDVRRALRAAAVWGPGLLVMLAGDDAGNVVTAAQSGVRWGYRLLPLLVVLIPVLYMIQELTVRLGIHTGRGHGELLRERLGLGWASASTLGLAAATIGSLITEFTAVAGIGELYGLPRTLTLPVAAIALLLVVATGSYRRVERVALVIGIFQVAFFAVAWAAHPRLAAMGKDALDWPMGHAGFLYLVAAIIGTTFNPWMIFYQQSATADKGLGPRDAKHARWDTAVGAALTQLLTGAVLIAAAATFETGNPDPGARLSSVGEISKAITPYLGADSGKFVFSVGVLGASLVAAIVSSLALAWGVGEIAGYRRSLERHPFAARWFYCVYAISVAGSAAAVALVPDLVWLTIAAQALNAFVMPLVIGLLVVLAATALPEPMRLRGWYLRLVVGLCTLVSALGLAGGIAGLTD